MEHNTKSHAVLLIHQSTQRKCWKDTENGVVIEIKWLAVSMRYLNLRLLKRVVSVTENENGNVKPGKENKRKSRHMVQPKGTLEHTVSTLGILAYLCVLYLSITLFFSQA